MNKSTIHAISIVNSLLAAGVEDAVLCPGSRNAPLSFALLAAAEQKALRLHVRIDERSAGFVALGLSRSSGKPVPVCATSGTAIANFYPACIEAHYSCIPLIIISANRDLRFRDSGVGQIISQESLFSSYVRHESHCPSTISESQLRQRMELGLTLATQVEQPGPVHFDIAFAEPLVPDENSLQELGVDPSNQHVLACTGKNSLSKTCVPKKTTDEVSYPLDISRNVLIIVGDQVDETYRSYHPSIRALLDLLPTCAEPTARRPQNYIHPFAIPQIHPDVVIIIGRPTLHREVLRLFNNPQIQVLSVRSPIMYRGLPEQNITSIDQVEIQGSPSHEWMDLCFSAHRQTIAHIEKTIANTSEMTGLKLASILGSVIAAGNKPYQACFLGASNSIRDIAIMVGPLGSECKTYANRGASGIDGSVSTSVGLALEHPRVVAMIGDLTFLHDVGGLLIGEGEPRPASLTIVVVNDHGGGIFSLLEQGDIKFSSPGYGAGARRIFTTPHKASLSHICTGMGVEHILADNSNLLDILSQNNRGIRVVEVVCSGDNLRKIHHDLKRNN